MKMVCIHVDNITDDELMRIAGRPGAKLIYAGDVPICRTVKIGQLQREPIVVLHNRMSPFLR